MVRFADLKKKNRKDTPEPKSSEPEFPLQEDTVHFDSDGWYLRASQFVESVFSEVQNEREIQFSSGAQLVVELVNARLGYYLPNELFILALHKEDSRSFLVANSVNVTVYAVLLGANLEMSKKPLVELGLAGLFHDLGKVRVPEEILFKQGPLTQQELSVLRRYPYESFQILRSLGDELHYLAESALNVNERLDGSGYPQGLQGDEIHPYAQIIGLVDVYEAITHQRPYRDKYLHFQAIKEIIKSLKNGFSREHFKALLQTFSIFPLYSYVKLNSGAVGRVIETREAQPLRPRVEIVMDAQEKPVLVSRIVDLAEQPILHIVESVAAEAVAQ
jgi:HD-GYP domain-containing protein (c-di-GMP phosphodiesterase class II)